MTENKPRAAWIPRCSQCSKHTLKNFLLSSKIPCTQDFQNKTRTVHKYSLKSLVAAYLFLSTRDLYVKYFLNTNSCMQDMQVGRSGTSEAAFTSKPDPAQKMPSLPFICSETPSVQLRWSSCGGHRLCCRLVQRLKLSDFLVANGRVTLWLPITRLTLLY